MPVNSFEYYPLTWRPDRNNLTRPVYLSLAQLLENDILNGVLRRDTKLPPQSWPWPLSGIRPRGI